MTLLAIEQHRVKLSNDMALVICEKFVGLAAIAAAILSLRTPMGLILAHPRRPLPQLNIFSQNEVGTECFTRVEGWCMKSVSARQQLLRTKRPTRNWSLVDGADAVPCKREPGSEG